MQSLMVRMRTTHLLALITLVLALTGAGAVTSRAAALGGDPTVPYLVSRLNQERRSHGLSLLGVDSRLETAAQAKAEAILVTNSFSHTLPDDRTPWDFFEAVGYRYELAGENLAVDFTNSEALHQAWLASQSHRDNMLDPAFINVGIASVLGELDGRSTTVVVELFATPDRSSTLIAGTPLTIWSFMPWIPRQ